MGRPLCFVPPNSMVEVTLRTVGGRFLFKPVELVRIGVLAALASALRHASVQLHAFVYLSNHAHLLMSVLHAYRMSAFLQYLNAATARVAHVATGWCGPVWSRPRHAAVLDDVAALERFHYVMSNAVKEGLVATPLAWPGASAAPALMTDAPVTVHVPRQSRRGRPMPSVEHTVQLAPLPAWRDLTSTARVGRVSALFDTIVERARKERGGRPPLGIDKLLAADPFETHELEERGPAPVAYASNPEILAQYVSAYRAFESSFRSASDGYRTVPPPGFPANSFPPSPAFVHENENA